MGENALSPMVHQLRTIAGDRQALFINFFVVSCLAWNWGHELDTNTLAYVIQNVSMSCGNEIEESRGLLKKRNGKKSESRGEWPKRSQESRGGGSDISEGTVSHDQMMKQRASP